MAAVSAIIGAAGLAISGASAVMGYNASKANAAAQAAQLEEDRKYAQLTNESKLKVLEQNKIAIGAQQEIQGINQVQMNLDATRRARELVRTTQASMAQARAVATNAGATGDGSSAMGGVVGGMSGRFGVNLLGIEQNREAGNAIFGQHQVMFNAYRQAAIDGYVPAKGTVDNTAGTDAATAAGLGSIGSLLTRGSDTFGKIGSYFGGGSSSGGIQVFDSNMVGTPYYGN